MFQYPKCSKLEITSIQLTQRHLKPVLFEKNAINGKIPTKNCFVGDIFWYFISNILYVRHVAVCVLYVSFFLCYPRKCIAKRIFLGNKWKLFTLHRIFSLCHLMWCSAAQSSVRHKARDEEKMNRKVIHKNSLQQWVHIAQCSVYT